MNYRAKRLLSRRSLLAGIPLFASGVWARRHQASSASQISFIGDCAEEPALQYLYDFEVANFSALPLQRMGSLDPGPDWVIAQSAELGPMMVPPGWSVVNAWANSFDRNGQPEWSAEQPSYPFWATTMGVSPDESAAFVHMRGAVDNVHLSPADGAQLTRDILLGPDARNQNICVAEQVISQGDSETANWVAGDRFGSDMLLSRGGIIVSSVSGLNLGAGSTFLLDAFMAPADQVEDLVLNVYLKILYQQIPKGGSEYPTPTPTP